MNTMRYTYIYYVLFSAFIFMTSCNLEREVEIVLPDYDSQPVVECYLEPGRPFRLLLSRSNAYFDPFPGQDDLLSFLDDILITDADVVIRYDGEEVTLRNELRVDPTSLKIFNYISDRIVPERFDLDYELEIILPDGTTIESQTRILEPIPIDSIAVEFDTLDMARTLVYIIDDKSESRFYRRMLHFGSLDSVPQQDFLADNSVVDNGLLVFGSGFQSEIGDTVINTIFRLDRAYFDFQVSVRGSIAANGNPFGQPGEIFSNVTGTANAIGIFTGLTFDRVTTIIEQ